MPSRAQTIDALRAKLTARPERNSEVSASKRRRNLPDGIERQPKRSRAPRCSGSLTTRRYGRGFSFQLPDRRVFIYEHDLRPGPDGALLAMAV